MSPKAPINTQAQDPLTFLLDAMMGVHSGGKASDAIERQEAQGQASFCASETLPTDIRGNDKQILEGYGIKFLGPVEGDKLFQYCELPAGWSKQGTDHSMHSNLVDDKGRVRAGIFYKAAFYDRSASLHLTRRFSVRFDYERLDAAKEAVSQVLDGTQVIFTTEAIKQGDRKSYVMSDLTNKVAADWLTAQYPNWEDASAYWD
jgi:hypothetical protein